MKKLILLACITLGFCMCSCNQSSIVDAIVVKADTEVLEFSKVQSSNDRKYFVETDLAEYDVNFVFSANSTTNRKIKIYPRDGDNVTVFVMDNTIYFIQGTCDKSYLDNLWVDNMHLILLFLVMLIAFIFIVALVAAFLRCVAKNLMQIKNHTIIAIMIIAIMIIAIRYIFFMQKPTGIIGGFFLK